jgi:hypothetical protein
MFLRNILMILKLKLDILVEQQQIQGTERYRMLVNLQ